MVSQIMKLTEGKMFYEVDFGRYFPDGMPNQFTIRKWMPPGENPAAIVDYMAGRVNAEDFGTFEAGTLLCEGVTGTVRDIGVELEFSFVRI